MKMVISKNKKIKFLFLLVVLAVFTFVFQTSVLAVTNPYVEITGVTVNEENNALKFSVSNSVSSNLTEYGVIFSRYDGELTLESNDEDLFIYRFTESTGKNYSVSIKIPKYALYQNVYAVAYIETEGVVYYSNKVYSSYAKVANLDKVVLDDISFENNALVFNALSSVDKNAEYGVVFSKNPNVQNLSLDTAKADSSETVAVKVNNLNENNQFKISINNIPVYEFDTTLKVCAYVKNLETLETYYTETVEFKLLDLYYEDIINNVAISYNEENDGMKFTTSTICTQNTTLGLVLVNKYSESITVDTADAYVSEVSGEGSFTLTMTNIPENFYDKEIYAVAYIKFLNENNEYEYYYSAVYSATYNSVKQASVAK